MTLIDEEIERVVAVLCRSGVTKRITEDTLRRHLAHVAERVASAVCSETLRSIRTAEEAAVAWGVSLRRAQAHIARLHQRAAVGMRVGRDWLITTDEIARHPPGAVGRPRK